MDSAVVFARKSSVKTNKNEPTADNSVFVVHSAHPKCPFGALRKHAKRYTPWPMLMKRR